MIQVTASDDSAVLRCSLYGYLSSMAVPSITWQLSNNELHVLFDDSVNTITSEQGDMFIQNGGAQPIPSLISTLTVNLTRDPLTTSRFYSCISSSQMIKLLFQVIVLSECSILYHVYWDQSICLNNYDGSLLGKLQCNSPWETIVTRFSASIRCRAVTV